MLLRPSPESKIGGIDPEFVLKGEKSHLIDEWQEVPQIWGAVRHNVDMKSGRGHFILTGSATSNDNGIMHSGAGRIDRIRMRTMSLFESGDSSGEVSLIKLFDKPWNGDLFTNQIRLEQLIHLTVRGGWPEALGIET